jgi:hypothetical protein
MNTFFHCVTEQWLPSSRRMTDNKIRDDLSFAFAPFYPAFAQKKAMLADAKKATQSRLLREIVVPTLTVEEADSLTRMHLIDAIYVYPKIVLGCVVWPQWIFKKTK